jgi:hypothetical protein
VGPEERGGGRGIIRGRGIEAAGVKRVALTQANDRKQAAPPGAVPLEARGGVLRTRRLEPANVAQERR